jgi:hypothetical protein
VLHTRTAVTASGNIIGTLTHTQQAERGPALERLYSFFGTSRPDWSSPEFLQQVYDWSDMPRPERNAYDPDDINENDVMWCAFFKTLVRGDVGQTVTS